MNLYVSRRIKQIELEQMKKCMETNRSNFNETALKGNGKFIAENCKIQFSMNLQVGKHSEFH